MTIVMMMTVVALPFLIVAKKIASVQVFSNDRGAAAHWMKNEEGLCHSVIDLFLLALK